MKTTFQRILSLLMVLVMLGAMLPAVYADTTPAEEPMDDPIVLTDEDYEIVNDVFAQIDAMEDAPAKKNATQTQKTDAAAQIVMASENYVEGSLERNGDSFTWWTDEGIRCVYNPRMREIYDNMQAPADPLPDGVYNEPVATKGGWPSGNQVYLIGPYYGSDASFTDQYKNEAKDIAKAIGDTDGYTLYSGTAATVDTVADAIENGAVVIFDSHGTTDYAEDTGIEDPLDPEYTLYDCVTGAKYSFLCLMTKEGLTSADYAAGAEYWTDSSGDLCVCINGAVIANHMEKNSPSGLLWMAICLGMATNTMCEPLREKGVEVVYGYSQSVTFAGDYLFEETFWDNIIAGKTVAQSVSAMKSKWGNWDWSTQIASYYGYTNGRSAIADARYYYSAFPIVVSDEDTHPGQRNGSNYGADSLQTVKSTYTLYSQYEVNAQSNNTAWGTVSVNGTTITAAPAEGYFAQSAQVTAGAANVDQNGNTFTVDAQSDCTVQINFAPKTAVTVSFYGTTAAPQNGYAGDAMTLPKVTAPEGYTFVGWTEEPLSGETTEKPDYYTNSFTPNGDTTLYALYSYVDENSGTGSGDYVKVTSAPADWSGEYLIVYEDGKLVFNGSLSDVDSKPNYKPVTIKNGTIAASEGDKYKFTIAQTSGGYSIQGVGGKYIGRNSNDNGLNSGTSALKNTISMGADGNVNIVGSGGAYLRYNPSDTRFRYFKSSTYTNQKPIALYVKDGTAGVTYYISTFCDHAHTEEAAAVAATCTTAGQTAGVKCTDCNTVLSGCEVIAALGHNWGAWNQTVAPGCETAGENKRFCGRCGETETQTVSATGHSMDGGKVTTAATCTAAGVMTYTCSACGHTTTQAIPAAGHSYDSGVITTPATCTADGVKTYTCSACGHTKTEAVPATSHSYADGVCTGCGAAEPVGPVMPKHGDQVVIYAPAYDKALSSNKVAVYYNQGVDITVSGGIMSGYGDTEIWTVIKNANGTYSFAYNGENIGLAESYTSMSMGAVYDEWNIISLGDGLYNIQNTVRGNYIEWYAGQDSWSAYNSKDAATDDRFQLSFYIVSRAEDPEEPLPEESEPSATTTNRYYIAAKRTSGNYFYMTSDLGTSSTERYQAVDSGLTALPDSITEPENGYVFVLTENGDGTYYIQAEGIEGENYLGYNKKNSGTLVSIDSALKVSIEEKDGKYNIHCNISGTERYLALNNTVSNKFFAWYTGEVKDLYLIPVVEKPAPVVNGVKKYGVVLGGELNVVLNVDLAADSQIVIEFNDSAYTYEADQLSMCDDGSYELYFPIAAAQMADQINVKFVSGETVTEGGSYTVQEYAETILQDASQSRYHDIVKAMLNYGGAAQVYFGYNTGNLVSGELGTETVPEEAEELIVEDTSDRISFYGASLVYRDKIAVRFYFTGNAEGMVFETDKEDTYTAQLVNGLWCVEVDNIMPYELDQQILLSTDGMDVLYGPMNYMVRMNQKGDAKLQNLMQALYNYCLTALEFAPE